MMCTPPLFSLINRLDLDGNVRTHHRAKPTARTAINIANDGVMVTLSIELPGYVNNLLGAQGTAVLTAFAAFPID